MLLQITALHTKVGKGHLKLDLNLMSGGWQRSHLGLAARASSPTPLKPQTLTLHLLREEVKFKEQNGRGKAPPPDTFSSSFYTVIAYNEMFGG